MLESPVIIQNSITDAIGCDTNFSKLYNKKPRIAVYIDFSCGDFSPESNWYVIGLVFVCNRGKLIGYLVTKDWICSLTSQQTDNLVIPPTLKTFKNSISVFTPDTAHMLVFDY